MSIKGPKPDSPVFGDNARIAAIECMLISTTAPTPLSPFAVPPLLLETSRSHCSQLSDEPRSKEERWPL
jgi:hypothetical protein